MMANPIETIFIKAFEGTASLLKGSEKQLVRHGEMQLGEAAHLYQPKYTEPFIVTVPERRQHTYILGASGSGKSKLLEYLIRQDIQAGRGFCLIDPHGDLYQNILNYLAGFYSK